MSLRRLSTELLRASMGIGPKLFVEEFPGSFLLALGLLAGHPLPFVETSDSQSSLARRPTQEYRAVTMNPEQTAVVDFGERLVHLVRDHPLAGTAFFIQDSKSIVTVVAGRGLDCDMQIPDLSVSRQHCAFSLHPKGMLMVTDLSSTNGTSVELQSISTGEAVEVPDSSIVTVGGYSFQHLRAISLYEAFRVIHD